MPNSHSSFKKPEDIDFNDVFAVCPNPYLLIQTDSPRFTIIDANQAYLDATGKQREDLQGQGLFEAFPDNPNDPSATGVSDLRASLERVLKTRSRDIMGVQKYDIPRPADQDGSFEVKYWSPVNTPILSKDGSSITAILHHVEDVTEFVQLRQQKTQDSAQAKQAFSRLEDMEYNILQVAQRLKQANHQLQESKEHFRIINTLPLVVWTATPDGNLTFISAQWDKFYGNPIVESLGSGWMNYVHPDDRADAAAIWANALQTGSNYETEFRVLHKSGEYRWILVRAIPIKNKEGTIINWYGSNTDIHDKKLAVESLKASEQRFSSIFNQSSVGIAQTDPSGKFVLANDRYCEIVGRSIEDLYQLSMQDITHPDDLAENAPLFEHIFQAGTSFKIEKRYLRPDGSVIWVHNDVSLTRDQGGNYLYSTAICQDITERKKAIDALRESEQRFRTISDNAPMFIFMAGQNAQVEFWNKTWLEFTGLSFEDAIQRSWDTIIHPEDLEDTLNSYRKAFHNREPFVIENRYKTINGDYHWVLWKGLPRPIPTGDFAGFVGVGVEIQNRKQAEQAMAEYQKLLEQSNKELEQFATIASHDLQEPLRKVRVFGEMLAPIVPPEGKEYLERMSKSAERMQNLISDLLTLSRVNRKGKPFAQIDLNSVAKTAVDDLQIAIQEAEAKIEINSLGTIQGDESQIRQLLQNLIGNALKYRQEGVRPKIKVHGELTESDHCYRLIVEDNGIGIKPEHYERIFEPFQRLHEMGKYAGTGMGLAICKKIAERHNGSISVESAAGEGSMFSVILPT